MNKPTSKIIQIQLDTQNKVIVALCEDGSIWARESAQECFDQNNKRKSLSWHQILEPHQPTEGKENDR